MVTSPYCPSFGTECPGVPPARAATEGRAVRADFAPECPQRQNSPIATGGSSPPTAQGKWGGAEQSARPRSSVWRPSQPRSSGSAEGKELQRHPGQCSGMLGSAPTTSGSAHLSFNPQTSEFFKSSHVLSHMAILQRGKLSLRGVHRCSQGYRISIWRSAHSLGLLF